MTLYLTRNPTIQPTVGLCTACGATVHGTTDTPNLHGGLCYQCYQGRQKPPHTCERCERATPYVTTFYARTAHQGDSYEVYRWHTHDVCDHCYDRLVEEDNEQYQALHPDDPDE